MCVFFQFCLCFWNMSKTLLKLDMEVEDSTGTSLRHRFILSNNLNLGLYTKTFRCKLTRVKKNWNVATIHPANFVALCFAVGSQPRDYFDVDRRPISLEIISSNAHQRTKEPWGTMNHELTNLWWDGKRDDTGKTIYVPWKKNSRSLEKIFTAPGKEI